MRTFLRSLPGWFAFQVLELVVLIAIGRAALALGVPGPTAFVVVVALAVGMVAGNYGLRRRYLSDDR